MINRGRGDIRRPALGGVLYATVGWRPVYLVGGLVDIACAVALALSLRWTPWRPAEAGPVPHTTGP
jgi:hypothetical protein